MNDRYLVKSLKSAVATVCRYYNVYNDIRKDKKTRRIKFTVSCDVAATVTAEMVATAAKNAGVDVIMVKVVGPVDGQGWCGYRPGYISVVVSSIDHK